MDGLLEKQKSGVKKNDTSVSPVIEFLLWGLKFVRFYRLLLNSEHVPRKLLYFVNRPNKIRQTFIK